MISVQVLLVTVLPFSPVKYEQVVHLVPRLVHHQGHVEGLFVGEHPGGLRHGEGEIVLVSEPEEDVLEGGAPSLVSLGESHLQNNKEMICLWYEADLSPRPTVPETREPSQLDQVPRPS